MANIIVLDCETTGLNTNTAHVIDVCIRALNDEKPVAYFRVRPPINIPSNVIEIHGITDEMVAGMPAFAQVADSIAAEIEWADIIVGYNPDYDIRMLKTEFERVGTSVVWPKTVICCKRLWDLNEPQPKRHLQAAYKRFVDPAGFAEAHSALADVAATAKLFKAIIAEYNLNPADPSTLDPERAKWFGPSDHIQWNDKKQLVFTFGKWKDTPVVNVDHGYYSYLLRTEFPQHVKDLIAKAKSIGLSKSLEQRNDELNTWAKNYS